MRFSMALAVAAALLLPAGGASAEISRADARAMMERSGFVSQLSGEAEKIRESFPKTIAGQVPPDLVGPMTEVVAAAWGGDRLLEKLEEAYAEILTPDDLDAINRFIDTALGQRVVAAETDGSSVAVWEEINSRRDELIAELEADGERREIVRRIDRATNATALSSTILMGLLRASMLAGAGDADPEILAQGEQFLEAMRPAISEDNRQYVLASFSRIYRDLPSDELGAYADYLETAPARAVNGVYFAIANEHYIAVGAAMGEGMARLFRQKRS